MKAKRWIVAALACCLVFGLFSGNAFGAATRSAVVTDVAGNVTVAKTGGALEIPVVTGMALHEGDRLIVGKGGYLILQTDRGDEITVGENWRGTLSMLRTGASGEPETAVKAWSGSVYSHVNKASGTAGTFRVEVPGMAADAKGTHFIVVFDPYTGLVNLVVNAGRVDARSDSPDDPGTTVWPSQQVTLYAGLDWRDTDAIDPEDIAASIDPEVLSRLLRNKLQIDAENDEMLNNPDATDGQSFLDQLPEDVLARYMANVRNTLIHLFKTAVENGFISEQMAEEILETVNQSIEDVNRRYDLDRDIPPIDRSVGLSPEEEAARQQQREQARQNAQNRQNQKEEKREAVRDRNQELPDRIGQQQEQQNQANEQAREDKLGNTLTEEQRQQLAQRLQERKAERQQPDRSPPSTPPSSSPSSPGSPANPAATATTVEASVSSVVYGQTFVLAATVTAPGSGAVPGGGTVDFKIDGHVIGSGAVADGAATLTVDGTVWAGPAMSAVEPGQHSLTAVYSGVGGQFAGSTSPEVILDIAKAETAVDLVVSPQLPDPGDLVTIRVNVGVKSPGGGEPAGTVTLYRSVDNGEWIAVGDPAQLAEGTVSVTFEDEAIRAGIAPNQIRYKAEFASGNGKYGDAVSDVVRPFGPTVLVSRSAEPGTSYMIITIELAHFAGDSAFREAEIRFRHHLNVNPDSESDMDTEGYDVMPNHEKLDDPDDSEDVFDYRFRAEEELDWTWVFTISSTRNGGVSYHTKDQLANIVINLTKLITNEVDPFRLADVKFTDVNGNAIDVDIQPGEGIVLELSEE